MSELLLLFLIPALGDNNYAVRSRAEERVYAFVMKTEATYALRLNWTDAEIRARCDRVLRRYRDIGEFPKPHEAPIYDGDWKELYERATGKSLRDTGHFFWIMPTREEENAMVYLWLEDRWAEGLSPKQVKAILGRK